MLKRESKVRIVAASTSGRTDAIGQTCEVVAVQDTKRGSIYVVREASGELGEYPATSLVDATKKPPPRFAKGDRIYIVAEVASFDEVAHTVGVKLVEGVSPKLTSEGSFLLIPDHSVIKPD